MSFVTTIQPAEFILGSSLQTQQTDSFQLHMNAKIRSAQNKSIKKHQKTQTSNKRVPTKSYQWTISWQRSASESKRRCLSSLQFSPLNLSWVHPCKPNKQIRFNCIWIHKSDQCKTKASKNIKKHRPATRGYQPKATNGPWADKGLHQKVSGDVFRHYNSARWIYLGFILANPTNRCVSTAYECKNQISAKQKHQKTSKNTDQ